LRLNKATTLSFPKSLLRLIDKVGRKRRDPTRSDTVRVLILRGLAEMGYLPSSEKKALGVSKLARFSYTSELRPQHDQSRESGD
jgi:metal-responsive CopG/Arc/MetJ family transcriptional regulator